jgi:hypothetical protein
MKTLDQLMDERHAAYRRAAATNFGKFIEEWREANRAYVSARDASRRVDCLRVPSAA